MTAFKFLGGIALAATMAVAGSTGIAFGQADDYPSKPIRIVTPFGAGGPIDIFDRALGDKITEITGQPFIHENITGGRQVPAAMAAKDAEPDGYTILAVTQNVISLNPLLIKDLTYDPQVDFEPVSLIVNQQHSMSFRGPEGTDWQDWDLDDLVAYSKANPGKIFYGSIGIGSDSHLAFEWVKDKTGADFTHVPYQAPGPMFGAFRAGDIQLFQLTLSQSTKQMYDDGFAKALAVPNPEGNPRLPGVPTYDEAIGPGFNFKGWTGWFVPAGTPKPIIDKIHDLIAEAMSDEAWVEENVTNQGFFTAVTTPEEFKRYLVEEDRPNIAALLAIAKVEAE